MPLPGVFPRICWAKPALYQAAHYAYTSSAYLCVRCMFGACYLGECFGKHSRVEHNDVGERTQTRAPCVCYEFLAFFSIRALLRRSVSGMDSDFVARLGFVHAISFLDKLPRPPAACVLLLMLCTAV